MLWVAIGYIGLGTLAQARGLILTLTNLWLAAASFDVSYHILG
ncbi:MAG TPA: hypothetical protein VMS21_13895 [Methylomirabilota bacterium]|nr:hypothetical protein [Methylomirabilota bacterium]